VGWGGESEGKGKTCGLGYKQFNRTAKGEENNKNNTDKNNTQHTIFSPLDAQLAPELQIPVFQPAPPLKH